MKEMSSVNCLSVLSCISWPGLSKIPSFGGLVQYHVLAKVAKGAKLENYPGVTVWVYPPEVMWNHTA